MTLMMILGLALVYIGGICTGIIIGAEARPFTRLINRWQAGQRR